ncbi:hypothetical protein [Paenibacillus sp. 32352]|uniref:hypothetical protein n=1 Tax=Paenibacillus sp. 32352 TaxID=1969111 RepID=UPI0009AC4069|nr:hypothetical protein [Paenibacillus sp. 32352]
MQDVAAFTTAVSVLAAISGIIIGWSGRSRAIRQDIKKEAGDGAVLHADVEYIKRGVDDIRLEQRAQGKRIDELAERVTRVEESAKQAHKRMDRLDLAPRHERED